MVLSEATDPGNVKPDLPAQSDRTQIASGLLMNRYRGAGGKSMKRSKASQQGLHARKADGRDAEVGRRVRSKRLECSLSQTDLADRVGVTFQQVQKYEKGVNRIGAGRLQRISEALGVPITFFFDATPSSRPSAASSSSDKTIFGLMQHTD